MVESHGAVKLASTLTLANLIPGDVNADRLESYLLKTITLPSVYYNSKLVDLL